MDITNFNRQNLKTVRTQIQTKLDELKALGLHINLGNISFSDTEFTGKIKCQLVAPGQVVKPECTINWEKGYNAKFGLPTDALHKEILFQNDIYIILGCKTRQSRTPIIIKRKSDDKRFRVGPSVILNNLQGA